MDRSTIRQLKMLSAIKPREEWKEKTRDILLSQMRSSLGHEVSPMTSVEQGLLYAAQTMRLAYRATFGIVFSHPVVSMASLVVVMGASLGVLFVAERSLPGDPLYAVKQTREEMSVAFLPIEQRPEAELARVQRRLEELRVLSTSPISPQDRERQSGEVIANLSKNISTVSENLNAVSETADPERAVHIASQIREQTASTSEKIRDLRLAGANGEKLDDARQSISQADQKALEVIVEKGEKGGLSSDTIASKLAQEVKMAQSALDALSVRVSIAAAIAQNDTSDLKKNADEATKSLTSAKESIEKNDFTLALEKLNQSKELITSIERQLKDAANNSSLH